jgi:hypothetical protein
MPNVGSQPQTYLVRTWYIVDFLQNVQHLAIFHDELFSSVVQLPPVECTGPAIRAVQVEDLTGIDLLPEKDISAIVDGKAVK